MAKPFTDGIPDEVKTGLAVPVNMPRVDYPFEKYDDARTCVVEQDYLQLGTHYIGTRPSLGSRIIPEQDALSQMPPQVQSQAWFFTGDSSRVYIGNGVFMFTRQCAPVPPPHTDWAAPTSWTKYGWAAQGFVKPIGVEADFMKSGVYYNPTRWLEYEVPQEWLDFGVERVVATWSEFHLSVVQNARVEGMIKPTGEGRRVSHQPLSNISGFGYAIGPNWGVIPSKGHRWITVTPLVVGGASTPRQENTVGFKVFNYFLDNAPNPENYRKTPFRVIDAAGNDTQSITGNSSPNFTEYMGSYITPRKPIMVNWSGLHRWLGNIYYDEETWVFPYL